MLDFLRTPTRQVASRSVTDVAPIPLARPRLAEAAALLFSGLLAGSFLYGGVNVLHAFRSVPLDMRLTFHTELMSANGVVMQALMAFTFICGLALTVRARGIERLLAGIATGLSVAVFLITRLGNVPINQEIKVWAVTGPPSGYDEILTRWEHFHLARVACAVLVFGLLVAATAAGSRPRAVISSGEVRVR
ncbi:DUF1772 domain-containing protein [Nocardia carnea]|uniref:DUF1772 domain-containing protein n=1 Tax=Nocardia carnea TaxID=37328 RepID=UPI00245413BF|nr:DUF1772 domain-containing protein [Nocardia carnea]